MTRPPIDLRSDTVTRPTPAMRRAMAEAEVGDDVYGEDPTVKALERRTAELLGKEAALFVPSGTMANQIAVGRPRRARRRAALRRDGPRLRLGRRRDRPALGRDDADVRRGPRPALARRPRAARSGPTTAITSGPAWSAWRTRTTAAAAGSTRSTQVAAIAAWARAHGLAMHLDGARLMNAVVASGIPAHEWARHFDTVSICFSKGLRRPVGSALAGPAEPIRAGPPAPQGPRRRDAAGGRHRRRGPVRAGASRRAPGRGPRQRPGPRPRGRGDRGPALESGPVETNLVWIAVDPALGTAAEVAARLRAAGVLVRALGPQVLRACTHLDVTRADVETPPTLIRRVDRRRCAA